MQRAFFVPKSVQSRKLSNWSPQSSLQLSGVYFYRGRSSIDNPAIISRMLSGGYRSKSPKPRPDPFARRPNQKCDPYGQNGKPLTAFKAEELLPTVHHDWKLDGKCDIASSENGVPIFTELTRRFTHPDFISGSWFLQHVAAVAQMNDHYPALRLDRILDSRRKQWVVISTITCHTFVLQGLSHHDFFVATVSAAIKAVCVVLDCSVTGCGSVQSQFLLFVGDCMIVD